MSRFFVVDFAISAGVAYFVSDPDRDAGINLHGRKRETETNGVVAVSFA